MAVEDLLETGEYETVYNMRVADFHTYFVGCEEWGFSVWAHNAEYLTGIENLAAEERGGGFELKSRVLAREMQKSQIGSEVLTAAADGTIEGAVSMQDFGASLRGQSFGNRFIAFVRATMGYIRTASTLIHEALHALGIGGTRKDEVTVRFGQVRHVAEVLTSPRGGSQDHLLDFAEYVGDPTFNELPRPQRMADAVNRQQELRQQAQRFLDGDDQVRQRVADNIYQAMLDADSQSLADWQAQGQHLGEPRPRLYGDLPWDFAGPSAPAPTQHLSTVLSLLGNIPRPTNLP